MTSTTVWSSCLVIGLLIFLTNPSRCEKFDMADKIREINEESDIIQNMLRQYDKHVRPPPLSNSDTPAVIVSLNFTVLHYGFETEELLIFHVDFEQSWFDSWLSYSRDASVLYVNLNNNLYEKIWTPDITLKGSRNSKSAKTAETSVKIFPSGLVQMVQKLTLKIFCNQNLFAYPLLDSKNCSSSFGSAKYGSKDILTHWNAKCPLTITEQHDIFTLENWHRANVTSDEDSEVSVWFFFRRSNLNHQLLVLYLPTAIGLLIVWLSLYLDQRLAPANLIMLTIVTMCYCGFYVFTRKPNSGSEWICLNFWDIWMLFCITTTLFVFLMTTLVYRSTPGKFEWTKNQKNPELKFRSRAADYLWSVVDTRELPGLNLFTDDIETERRRLTLGSLANTDSSAGVQSSKIGQAGIEQKSEKAAKSRRRILIAAKIVFLLMVVVFNLAYWLCAWKLLE